MSFRNWWDTEALSDELIRTAMLRVSNISNMSERCSALSEFWAETAWNDQALKVAKLEKKLAIAKDCLERIIKIETDDVGELLELAVTALKQLTE